MPRRFANSLGVALKHDHFGNVIYVDDLDCGFAGEVLDDIHTYAEAEGVSCRNGHTKCLAQSASHTARERLQLGVARRVFTRHRLKSNK